jgi:hypothetical protein
MAGVAEALRLLLERPAEAARSPSPSAVAATTFVGRAAPRSAPARATSSADREPEAVLAAPDPPARPPERRRSVRSRTLALALAAAAVVAVGAGALVRPHTGRQAARPAPAPAASTPAPAISPPATAVSAPALAPAVPATAAPPPRAAITDAPERAAAKPATERRARAPHRAPTQRSPDVDDGIINL